MNERVKKLRQQSVSIKPYISTERAELITEFYKRNLHLQTSQPIFRALSFKYIMENKIPVRR